MFIFNSIKYNNLDKNVYLEPYELSQGSITGYKIYSKEEQIATLEFRNCEWIVAMIDEDKLIIRKLKDFSEACDWVEGRINKEKGIDVEC